MTPVGVTRGHVWKQALNLDLKLSSLLPKESAVPSLGAPPRGGLVACARRHAARSLSAIR
jgi:hypothetical protein